MILFHLFVNCLRVVWIDCRYVCRVCFDCVSQQWCTVGDIHCLLCLQVSLFSEEKSFQGAQVSVSRSVVSGGFGVQGQDNDVVSFFFVYSISQEDTRNTPLKMRGNSCTGQVRELFHVLLPPHQRVCVKGHLLHKNRWNKDCNRWNKDYFTGWPETWSSSVEVAGGTPVPWWDTSLIVLLAGDDKKNEKNPFFHFFSTKMDSRYKKN
jgi:hypothetical protein